MHADLLLRYWLICCMCICYATCSSFAAQACCFAPGLRVYLALMCMGKFPEMHEKTSCLVCKRMANSRQGRGQPATHPATRPPGHPATWPPGHPATHRPPATATRPPGHPATGPPSHPTTRPPDTRHPAGHGHARPRPRTKKSNPPALWMSVSACLPSFVPECGSCCPALRMSFFTCLLHLSLDVCLHLSPFICLIVWLVASGSSDLSSLVSLRHLSFALHKSHKACSHGYCALTDAALLEGTTGLRSPTRISPRA